ncbi:hypothetical protein DQ238_19875 [Geodermatophilus sp. TF02-6]|uniref:hypothetical protein n=1 Tax=Geodermatophilus sp. TF02-6 TaxID=2250575 RepID=UPI000DE85F41|nr:hypothetical protein [Geodermatophilus sp. TF02-6]RBY75288.1 hypothetical protein DQ238_19875 [Geodermatophilus sp. TF02-6]
MSTTQAALADRTPLLVGDRSDRFTRSLIAWTGLVTAALSAAAVLLDAPSWLRLVTVLAFVCAGPGAAVMAHVPVCGMSTSWALTNVLSLAVWAVGTAVLAWVNHWAPTALLLVLAAGTVLSCGWAELRTRRVAR